VTRPPTGLQHDKGVERVARIEHRGLGFEVAGPAIDARAGPLPPTGGRRELGLDRARGPCPPDVRGIFGPALGNYHLELHDQAPAHRAGHRVLDEPEVAGLDPIADEGVGDSEHDAGLLDGHRRDPGQVGLPDGVGHLLTQGLRAKYPQLFSVVHMGLRPWTIPSVHKDIDSCGRAPICLCPGIDGGGAPLLLVFCAVRRGQQPTATAITLVGRDACCVRNGTP
jgi:hypothetical protein